jgi:acetyltransferase-like isoleucine patch superfamily enzyme
MKKILLLLCVILPVALKLFIYRRILGWKIGNNVMIGISYLDVKNVCIGDEVHIGNFNVIRRLSSMSIGEKTKISNFNGFYGAVHLHWESTLVIGKSVNFTSHHFLDVGGLITIGDNSIIGGRDSQFWAHGLVYDEFGNPALRPLSISIGNKVYIGSRSTLIGCSIPDSSVVGAASVITKQFDQQINPVLIAGNPATIRKHYKHQEKV